MPSMPEIVLTPSAGPTAPPSSAAGTGLFPGEVLAWQCDGRAAAVELGRWTATAGMRIEVAVFPDWAGDFAATEAWFQLDDGAGPRPAVDQYGHDGSRTPWLVVDQWNLVALDTAGIEPGREVVVTMTLPEGGPSSGWVQPLGLRPVPEATTDLVDLVRTARGSHSRGGQSRGNTYPLACLPHGFSFVSPMSDASCDDWIFTWHPDGGPKLQALAFCHAPSPWISDRSNIQLMPFTGEPDVTPAGRERRYDPLAMVDRAHLFGVQLEDGTTAEVTPTDHGAVFRFTFTSEGRRGAIVDQALAGHTSIELLDDGRAVISGHTAPNPQSNRRILEPVGYFWGITRQRVRIVDGPRRRFRRTPARPQTGIVELVEGQVLEVAMATSFIGIDQARHNLELEIGEAGFAEVLTRAREAWSRLLGRMQLEGASHDQLVHAASNMARLHCWPNSMHENRGSGEAPEWVHASPFLPTTPRSSRERTASPVVSGQIMVNNGYWDTYRTCWPAYNLFTPDIAPALTDGLLAAWRESGWMGRWSAPGHVDCMVGTSSDVIFADASVHGLDFDEVAAYDSALRNACCPSPDKTTGRKGIGRGRFMGYIAAETDEGFSWSIENAICDAAIASWSARLAERADQLDIAHRVDELRANAVWFDNRARSTRQLFDPATGFHRGRTADGAWHCPEGQFDPRRWGDDYTETNAWGMSASTVQDGRALAELHGGPAGLGEHLDRLFATQELADQPGGYGGVIHEMVEARALRLGECGLSNQPAHHIAFMYAFTDRPWQTQQVVADMRRRLFVGNEIGQGYPGDEDNGEMSAWWLFANLGLYPLFPSSGEYLLTSPAFSARVERPEGALAIVRHGEGDFIERVTINGEPWQRLAVPVERLRGEVTIAFWLTQQPTDFGLGHFPASLDAETPWRPDLASDAHARLTTGRAVPELVNDHGDVPVELPAGVGIELVWDEVDPGWAQGAPSMLTITVDRPCELAPVVQLGEDPVRTVELSPRRAQWPQQTVAWQLPELGNPAGLTDMRRVVVSFDRQVTLRQMECW